MDFEPDCLARPRTPVCTAGAYIPYLHGGSCPRQDSSHSSEARVLPCYAAHGCLTGRMRVRLTDAEIRLSPGELVMVAPGVSARPILEEQVERVWLNFDVWYQPHRARRTPLRSCDVPGDWPGGPVLQPSPRQVWGRDVSAGPYTHLADQAARIVRLWRSAGTEDLMLTQWRIRRLLDELLWEIVHRQDPAADISPEERIAHAEAVAVASLEEPFGVAEFARAAHMSRCYFSTTYRRLRGRSPLAFLTEARLNRAKDLLRQGASVQMTARQLGFAGSSSFIHFFKRQTGCSPGKW